MVKSIKCGDIVLVDLNPIIGSEQAGMRPAITLQIDKANAVSPCTIIAPCTTKIRQTLLNYSWTFTMTNQLQHSLQTLLRELAFIPNSNNEDVFINRLECF